MAGLRKWFGWRRLAGGLGLLLLLAAAFRGLVGCVPLPPGLDQPPPAMVRILDRQGRLLRECRPEDGFFHLPVRYEDLPRALVDATVAAEDKRFWDHPGVDLRAYCRAALSLLWQRRVVSGGSTITQQLIKLSQPRPRTFRTKIIEAFQALKLETVWNKQRILEAYFNRLNYGNLNGGPAAAARFYYGKPLADLSLAEAALLAGLPQAPGRLNPLRHPARARHRQSLILDRMIRMGVVGARPSAAELARDPLVQPHPREFLAPHFVDWLLEQAARGHRPAGPEWRTSLDLELQQAAEQALAHHLRLLAASEVHNGAVVVLDNATSRVRAWVGSENYFSPRQGQVNGVWAQRSAGSTLKPFTYWLALEQGSHAATVVADVPVDFPTPTGLYSPVNYHRRCSGPVSYRLALANSLNIPAVQVLHDLGGAEVLQTRLRACGLQTLTAPADYYGLGLTIGNAEVRLLELANAYACLARQGDYRPWQVLDQGPLAPAVRVGSPGAAWLVADILSDASARGLAFGSHSPLQFGFPVACKTGTSSDFRDNWAVAFTPEFTVAVWVGNFDGQPMRQVSGISGAAPVMHEVMQWLHDHSGTTWYAPPADVREEVVHRLNGKRITAGHPLAVREKFLPGTSPESPGPADFDAAGRVRLPAQYARWFDTPENPWRDQAFVAAASGAGSARLVSPLPGTVVYLDPDLGESGRQLPLLLSGAADVEWRSPTLTIARAAVGPVALLRPGRHQLSAHHAGGGVIAETWIEVKKL
jgi:penicillin-binding protein 1C